MSRASFARTRLLTPLASSASRSWSLTILATSSALGPATRIRYDRAVDTDRSTTAPRPRLGVGHESARDHGGVQLGLVRDLIDVQCQIRIRGHRRDSQITVADTRVDRLGSDQHDRCPLLADCL